MKKIGEVMGVVVFTDEFKGKQWVNLAKWPKVIKISPEVVDKVVEMLVEAKESSDDHN